MHLLIINHTAYALYLLYLSHLRILIEFIASLLLKPLKDFDAQYFLFWILTHQETNFLLPIFVEELLLFRVLVLMFD